MLSSASPAAASEWTTGLHQFCWGVVLGDHGFCDANSHDGQAGYATEVSGSGVNHSVCVEARFSDGIRMCSGGPNQGVYNFSPSGNYLSIPNITNNAAGNNNVHASAYYCVTLGC
jgi:hypothetical protein